MPAPRKALPDELTGGIFTYRQAQRARLPLGVLRGPGVQTLVRGVYLDGTVAPTFAEQVSAHLTVLPPDTAVDGVTALRCLGIEVGDELPYRFVTTAEFASKRPQIRVRRVSSLPELRGSVAAPLAALVAAKVELDLLALVVAGDWLVHTRYTSLPAVQQALQAATGRHCRRARRAGELIRAGAESPRESRLRLVIVLAGLPEPECNVEIGNEWRFIGRVDLYLRAWGIAVEYEGEQHRTDAKVFGDDLQRYEQLTAAGLLIVRVSKAHLRRPRDVVQRVFAALVSRGYDGPPPVFGAEWRSVFE